jgi:hypothetical protein
MWLASLVAGCGGLAADGPGRGGPPLNAPRGSDDARPDGDGRALSPQPEAASGGSLLDLTLNAMAEDLQAIGDEQRRFMRYVTVSHVRNSFDARSDRADTAASDIDGARDVRRLAVTKLVNSVSTESAIAVPMEIGQRLYQRIDLRQYGWDRPLRVEGQQYRNGWEPIVDRAQHAVEFQGPAAERLQELSGVRVPWLMADDFVATVSSGEVYYELLRVPATLDALQANLGVASGSPPLELYRAGFGNSLLSFNPRVVERYGGAQDGFWQALDFADAARGNAIFSDPLSIEPDATEVIFSLPNGLRGYVVTDGAGQRVPVSSLPTSVISDPLQPDGIMRNPASCFSCHNAGLVPFRDQVRERLPALPPERLPPELLASALATFPEPGVLDGLAESDDARYFLALQAAGVPAGIIDPISLVYAGFWDEVGPRQAAGELFVEPGVLRSELSRLPDALAPLATPAGLVGRSGFVSAYVRALCILHAASENRPSGC